MAWRFLWAISPHPRPSSCTPRTSTERDSVFRPSLINFSPKILVFLKIALYFLGMQLGVSPAELSRGSDPKASALRSSRRPSADSAEGLRRVPNEVVPRLRRPKPGVRIRGPRGVLPQGDRHPSPSAPPSYSLLSQTPRPELRTRSDTPGSSRELRSCRPRAPPRCGAGPVLRVRCREPQRCGLGLGAGVGGSLPRGCPSRASARASRLPQPPRAPARLPPAAPRPRPQYPDGSRSYLQGPPRLSASPPPSCISERLHFSGSQL